MSLDDKILII